MPIEKKPHSSGERLPDSTPSAQTGGERYSWDSPEDEVKLMEINAAIHDLEAKVADIEMALHINKSGK